MVRLHQRLEHAAFFRDQLVVGAPLGDLPLGHDDDVISLVHELQLVRDQQHGLLPQRAADALAEEVLTHVSIKRRQRIVHHD